MHHNFEISTCDPLNYEMDKSILILSTCLGESIRMKRVTCKEELRISSHQKLFYFYYRTQWHRLQNICSKPLESGRISERSQFYCPLPGQMTPLTDRPLRRVYNWPMWSLLTLQGTYIKYFSQRSSICSWSIFFCKLLVLAIIQTSY